MKTFLLFIFLITGFKFSIAQKDNSLNDTASTEEIAVTATKTDRDLSKLSIPVSVIEKKDIENTGVSRLTDILELQTGLNITNFLGQGVQLQGLDADYTLILVDGEPLIGRLGGTLDLSRVTLKNVSRIEIVKGPSSSLYGSDALAGVINVITDNPKKDLDLNLNAEYGTFNTIDLSLSSNFSSNDFTGEVFLNRYNSNGYKLNETSVSLTSPEFSNYTLSSKLNYGLSSNTSLGLSARYFTEKQDNQTVISNTQGSQILDDNVNTYDYNLILNLKHNFDPANEIYLSLYIAGYDYREDLDYKSGESFFKDYFNQNYYKAEINGSSNSLKNNTLTGGTGYITEYVSADRISEGAENNGSFFAYIQNEFFPLENFNVVAGLRFDSHSDYESQISPKISFYYSPLKFIKILSSYGFGYKAPTFQQLYLNFTNPQVGYSVYGTYDFLSYYNLLLSNGEISQVLLDPNNVQALKPENSKSLNAGLKINFEILNVNFNYFRNNIRDLIDVQTVAKKTNGQSVFSYFNLNRIYTEGFETELNFDFLRYFNFGIGYQYLSAIDEDIIDRIGNKEIFKVGSTGVLRPVQLAEYGGLFNRSKNSGTVKLNFFEPDLKLNALINVILKGKYGYADFNSNGILDNENEYIPGYVLTNINFKKNILDNLDVIFGIDNIFDRTNPELTPEYPGRIIYGGFNFNLK